MIQRQTPSITYDAPPLVEVAMSVQFDPPKGLNQAHLGAFWATQRDSFPRVRSVQPISTANEVFGDQGQWLPPALQLALTNEPDTRLQMTSLDDQWMCQIQRNRIVINWRRRSEQYPRYGATWSRFQAVWQAWQYFVADLELSPAMPRLWELTYVNRIQKTDLWQSPRDWPNVFPGLWGGEFTAVEGARLRGLQGQWVWESPDPVARLYVEPKPSRSNEQPPQDILLLSLTARGPIQIIGEEIHGDGTAHVDPIESGVAFGHTLIVRTFDKISSDEAKKAWGRHADPN